MGPFIRLWAQDDVMKPYSLEREITYFEPHTDCAHAYSAYDVIDDDGRVIKKRAELTDVFVVRPDIASEIMFITAILPATLPTSPSERAFLRESDFFGRTCWLPVILSFWCVSRQPILLASFTNRRLTFARMPGSLAIKRACSICT
jgi:hypothetical protein